MEDTEGIERRVVLQEPFVVAWPLDAELRLKNLSLAGLAEAMPLIRYTTRSNIGLQIERYLRRSGLDVPKRLELDSSNSVLTMVSAGLGCAINTPLCRVQSDRPPGRRAPGAGARSRARSSCSIAAAMNAAAERVHELASSQLRELLTSAYQRRCPGC
jgi:DNA-binding transcriptional LysR family regulator